MTKRIHSVLTWPARQLNEYLHSHFEWSQRFNDWANEKERAWRRRRNRSLVATLSDAGMHEQAERLS